MAYLNVRNGGTTYSVGCLSSKAGAVPSGVPPLCVYSGGTTYYAKVSSSSTNAVASYRAGSATYYVVTKALKSEVESWVTLYSYSASSASSYTLSSTYLGYPLYIQVTGGAGSSGSRPSVSSTVFTRTVSTGVTTTSYVYLYGGLGGSGGNGGSSDLYILEGISSQAVFTVSLASGSTGSTGSTGLSSGLLHTAAVSGGSGGSGGVGYAVSVTGDNSVSYSCTAYGGGGGGGGGGAGALLSILYGTTAHYPSGQTTTTYPSVSRYALATGAGGAGGSAGTVSGGSGSSGQYTSTSSYVDLSSYWSSGNIIYNSAGSYGKGGTGASPGSSTVRSCIIKVGLLQ